MKFQLITEQPLWWLIFCIALGIGYAVLLYRNEKSLEALNVWLRRMLFVFRAVVVTILAFLLLTPLIKINSRETEKPILVFAQDNSRSILLNKDSVYYRQTYPGNVQKFIDAVKDKYDVKTISWGDRIQENIDYTYNEQQTDFSGLLDEVNVRYGNRNVGALVIASDGLYNRGSNPVYSGTSLKVPVYTIALGDTSIQKDLLIKNVSFNKIVYLGNSFPVQIMVAAKQCSGAQTTLTVKHDSVVLFSRTISVSGNNFNQEVPVILDAKKKGILHYKLSLSSVNGEITLDNNSRDIYIEVLENKQKIYLVSDAPHPDLGVIKTTIEASQNYAVKIAGVEDANESLRDYNLLILHNLPSGKHDAAAIIRKAAEARIPILYILGTQTNVRAFNALNTGLSISGSLDKSNPVQAAVNPGFSLFTLSDEMRHILPEFPPLLAPFGRYTLTASNAVLLNQQIGAVSTEDPLLVFFESGESKTGVLCGEGIWRWKLADFRQHDQFNAFTEILTKTIQNLCTRENKTHFKISVKNSFAENEPVSFDAEVYNDNYELINTPDINLTITNTEKKSFPYTFSKTERAYSLSAGYLSAGEYKYKSTVKLGDKVYTAEGAFSVSALQAEQTETSADHQLMYNFAHKNGGELFYPNQLTELQNALLAREDIKTVSYAHYKLQDLVNIKLVFFLLLALLSLEWFLRKRAGAY
ncbi:MAG: hypothetical protein IPJ66_08710 [Bacteroidetes bacterium]|nr:hypothetical protein [Bacteroidota bacterium]